MGFPLVVGAFLAIALVVAPAPPVDPQEPALAVVLERAGSYVAEFERRLSGIAAEERYVQDWKTLWQGRKGATDLGHRELVSDLLLVRPPGADEWVQYRDVFDVDGTAVRDRAERLMTLLRRPSSSSAAQIGAILDQSARYNIGDIQRNVNTPLFPLRFLERANQSRFRFKRTADVTSRPTTTDPERAGAFRVSTEVWVIAYDERRSDTMIRTLRRKDFPARGRFWIEPATGRVLMSELLMQNRDVRVSIDVSFQSEPLLGVLVPIEMRERYQGERYHSLIECRATYGKFRQLQK